MPPIAVGRVKNLNEPMVAVCVRFVFNLDSLKKSDPPCAEMLVDARKNLKGEVITTHLSIHPTAH